MSTYGTEEEEPKEETPAEKEPPKERSPISEYLAQLGRKGGMKGGKARAAKQSAKKRREIAQNAAKSRWSRKINK